MHISPHQCGPKTPVQSCNTLGPQQLSGDLYGRRSHGLRPRDGVIGTAKNCAGPAHLQRCYNSGHHSLLGSWQKQEI